jgi:catechol 2,3-dioxygenase-like lactoylglutathione lyase family enzyme
MAEAMLSHLGICVTDVDRSRRFYCELFGYEAGLRSAGLGRAAPADLSTCGCAQSQPVEPGTT